MARGFHAAPVFGIFGAAIAAAKLGGLDENQINGAIAQCVNLAAGNLEGAQASGGRSLREGGAVRDAAWWRSRCPSTGRRAAKPHWRVRQLLLSAVPMQALDPGGLQSRFTGDNRTDMAKRAQGLGRDWIFLETLYRIYSTAGYNIAHIDVTAKLCPEPTFLTRTSTISRPRWTMRRDRISEPGLSEPRHRQPATNRQHAVFRRTTPMAPSRAAIRCCAATAQPQARATRRPCSS